MGKTSIEIPLKCGICEFFTPEEAEMMINADGRCDIVDESRDVDDSCSVRAIDEIANTIDVWRASFSAACRSQALDALPDDTLVAISTYSARRYHLLLAKTSEGFMPYNPQRYHMSICNLASDTCLGYITTTLRDARNQGVAVCSICAKLLGDELEARIRRAGND